MTAIPSPTLAELTARVLAFAEDREWGMYHSPRNLAMAVSVEAGELLELYLWSRDDGPQPFVASRRGQVADEAADVLICLLNFCHRAGVDLGSAVDQKLAKAAEKYPIERVKGRALKYDEYAEWQDEPSSADAVRAKWPKSKSSLKKNPPTSE
jgi:NTP pyrophosphatase (non-canonical NTP hydrolase)